MARLLENQAKDLLSKAGVKVPLYRVAAGPEEAARAAADLAGPVVVKALVPVGRRGKAGAVRFAADPAEAAQATAELLAREVANWPVRQVLVEERLEIEQEMYLSFTIDRERRQPVVLASSLGGVEIEEISREHPDRLVVYPVDPLAGLAGWEAREVWWRAGLAGQDIGRAAELTVRLYAAFVANDSYLLEVNPLVRVAGGEFVVAAAMLGFDDAAAFRHPELAGVVELGMERSWRPLTELERRAVAVNEAEPYRGTARYTEMDGGDIGFMCGGGGASLVLFDSLSRCGGRPANYSEFGGNPTADKVCGLVKVILTKPGVKGLFVAQNITNNTQVDLVAEGVVRALSELRIDPRRFPVLVREAGVNEQRAREVFTAAGVEYYGDEISLSEAARRMVEKMSRSGGGGSGVAAGGREGGSEVGYPG